MFLSAKVSDFDGYTWPISQMNFKAYRRATNCSSLIGKAYKGALDMHHVAAIKKY